MDTKDMPVYDHMLRRIGVIHKTPEDALAMYENVLSETDTMKRENIEYYPFDSTRIQKVDMVLDLSDADWLPEGATEIIRTRYSFHMMNIDKHAWNVSGMRFSGFHFCEGPWNAFTLNYLMSRIRG